VNYQSNDHLVRYADLRYARAAFVDARTPGSHLKENYCIIGKGVSENPRQPIHIHETDGFHVGAAGQPPGILNSLHSHYTAEIFMIFKGRFRIYWGPEGTTDTFLGPGEIISVPVHCFRGFEVVGDDSGFLFAVLGSDDCGGGIEWHPDVILEGRRHGTYLLASGRLADTVAGDPQPADEDLLVPMSKEEVLSYDDYTVDQMMQYVCTWKNLRPRENEFSGRGSFTLYHICGHPDNDDDFEIRSRDGVCIYAYEMENGGAVPMHRRNENQVLMNLFGDVRINFRDSEFMPITLGPGDVYDMPTGIEYSLSGVRGTSYTYCVVKGDYPPTPEIL